MLLQGKTYLSPTEIHMKYSVKPRALRKMLNKGELKDFVAYSDRKVFYSEKEITSKIIKAV